MKNDRPVILIIEEDPLVRKSLSTWFETIYNGISLAIDPGEVELWSPIVVVDPADKDLELLARIDEETEKCDLVIIDGCPACTPNLEEIVAIIRDRLPNAQIVIRDCFERKKFEGLDNVHVPADTLKKIRELMKKNKPMAQSI